MIKAYTALKIAFLSCFIAYSVVDADIILKVTGDNVNLRAIADGESEVVSQVSRGSILHADKLDGDNWVSVSVPDGVAVWVYADLVRDEVVAVSKLSVRSGPGINYRTVGMVLKGEKVIPHGVVSGWLKITAPTNCRVWVSSKYVEVVDSTITKVVVTPVEKPIVTPVIKPVIIPVSMPKPAVKPVVIAPPEAIEVENPEPVEISTANIKPTEKSIIKQETNSVPKLVEPPVVAQPVPPIQPVEVVIPAVVKPIQNPPKTIVVEPDIDVSIKDPEIKNGEVKDLVDEAVTELVVIARVDELEQESEEEPVVEVVSDLDSDPGQDVEGVAVLISETVPTPEMVVMPLIIEEDIEPTETIVVTVTEDVVIVDPKELLYVEPVVVESVVVEPVVETMVEEDKYAHINTNNIPEGIDYRRLVLSIPQGTTVVLNGRLKRAGKIIRRRPSRYRIIGNDANSYIISDDIDFDELLGQDVKVTGTSYWIQGVRDMIISVDNISILQ